ncbi:MBL fold metallo-hydrolase [Tundrisphaera lichenicola]|uniref:MBL fold metallo-hydrolase n=1 Tax=Tundrisphaera lichenicola TaxID=2029860 RepID=UPI003EBD6FEC
MNRRDTLKMMASLAASSAWASPALSQQVAGDEIPLPELMAKVLPAMNSIPIEVSSLGSRLYLVTGPGGNVAVSTGPDGAVVVDSFVPLGAVGLIAAIRKRSEGPLTLIDTHWHLDHAGGNGAFADAGAKIVAHENTRKRLGSEQYMADYKIRTDPAPEAALPVVTIGDEATLYLNGEEIRLIHVAPAHTDGDVFLHFRKANVLHAGDLFAKGAYPNIDSSSGGWIGGMVAAADRMLEVADASTRIIPGHGPMANPEDLRDFRDMLAQARAKVEPLFEAGKTVDEVAAARPLASLDARWGQGVFKGTHFARLVYSGLVMHRGKA